MSWRRWLALLLLAAAPAAGEAALLRAVGFGSALSLAPQITSISPYGSFHDLRWILVYHSSWPVLVVELLAAVVIRTGWAIAMSLAAAPYAAGPGAAGSPSAPGGGVRVLAVRVLAFHAFAVVVLAPWATMAVAAAQTSLSWFLPGEVLPLLLLGLVLHRGGTGQSWWRGAPSRRLLGLGLVAFATVPAASLVVASTPKWWVVPVAGAAGATNGWLWRQVVCSPALPADRRIGRAPVPIIVAGALLLSLASAGPLAGLGRLNTQEPLPAVTGPLVTTVRRPVIFVGGYDTDWDGSPTRVGLPLETFSYRGLNPAGRPLPYRTTDTHTSLAHTAALLRSQVSAASRQAGRPVSLIAMSEGTLVVRRYLADTPDPSVNAVVLISPLIQASRVYLNAVELAVCRGCQGCVGAG